MRFFGLLNLEDVFLYLFPAALAVLLIGVALHRTHFHGPDTEARHTRIIHRYPEEIEERNAPFPLVLILIISGTVLWAFFYILLTGWLGVKI